jgi:hypothetical protein
MKMEVTPSSEISVEFLWNSWRYIPEDGILNKKKY